MKYEINKIKKEGFIIFGLSVMVGCYNAFVINSDSQLSDKDQHFKRLDEIYGVTVPGRAMAGSLSCQKLNPTRIVARDQQIQKLAEIKNTNSLSENEDSIA
jgi:hypothetical protein